MDYRNVSWLEWTAQSRVWAEIELVLGSLLAGLTRFTFLAQASDLRGPGTHFLLVLLCWRRPLGLPTDAPLPFSAPSLLVLPAIADLSAPASFHSVICSRLKTSPPPDSRASLEVTCLPSGCLPPHPPPSYTTRTGHIPLLPEVTSSSPEPWWSRCPHHSWCLILMLISLAFHTHLLRLHAVYQLFEGGNHIFFCPHPPSTLLKREF